ncbi:MAG TPA: DUF1223 domain-containing protein [Thermoanaerobaculia bacterium]|jgi:hypothetical protein|nr:DUF1223 domain-containing protein [Thermoanaerobaculia bacterium]
MRGRALLIAAAAALAAGGSGARGDEGGAASTAHPVVVELFTAQGCSSCPPADRLLAQLGAASGGRVVPLEFHVDFWNQGGWTDPFSSAEWTRRQEAYAKRFGATQLYTPQAIVDGASEMIGSREAEVRAAVAAASAKPAAAIALTLEPSAKDVRVGAKVDLPEPLRGRKWHLMLAVYETGLVTPVARGENGGKTLENEYVVRSLRRAGGVDASGAVEARLPLDKGWNRARVGVAAFLQDPATLEIRGAAASALPAH